MAKFQKEDGTIVELTPEQETFYKNQTTGSVFQKEDGTSVNPFQEFSSDQLFELAVQDPDNFQLGAAFRQNKHLWNDQTIIQKVADSLDKVKARGFEPEDLPGAVKKAVPAALEIGKGLGKNLWTLFKPVLTPGGSAAEAVRLATGNKDLELQRERLEAVAGMEMAVSSFSHLIGKKLPEKVVRIGEEILDTPRTPEQKISDLWTEVGYLETEEAAATGKGPFTTFLGGELVKETPPRPEEVATRAAGDPFTFLLFSKGFKGVHKVGAAVIPKAIKTAVATAGAKVAAGAPAVVGRGLAGIGPVVDLGEKVGSVLTKGAGLAARGVAAIIPPVFLPSAVRAVGRGLGAIEPRVGAGMVRVGEQMAGEAPLVSSVAQLGTDLAQTVPGAIAKTVEGTAIDIAFAAATSESPQDTHGIGLGTIFGLAGGAGRVGGRALSGQLIAPRAWGVKGIVLSSGKIPVLDTMHKEAYDAAPEGVKERLNAVRLFLKGAAPGVDLFLTKDTESMKRALIEMGLSESQATEWANQEGVFSRNLNGRKVAIVKNIDSAPHEAKHIIQDVLGESANRVVDDVVKIAYKDRWNQEGRSYANRLLGKDVGSAWRDVILDFTGEGHAAGIEKIALTAENNLREVLGREPTFQEVKAEVEGAWRNAITKAKLENPQFSEQAIAENAWRGILEAKEVEAVSDRYLARELAAENFDAAFKNLGGSLAGGKGVIPTLARIVAKTVQAFGGEPLEGRVSEIGQTPLKIEAVEAVTKAARGVKPTVEPKGAKPIIRGGIPATSDERQKAADEARQNIETASDKIPAGGTKSQKEVLGDVAEAIANQSGVKINYLSAPDEPAASITSNRNARREMIEAYRTMPPEARALWEKNFFPERVLKTKSGLQVMGWAPEVFASNAHKLAQSLSERPELSPYPIDPATKSFTPEGWAKLYEDAQVFVENQMGGRTGSGIELVVPREATGAYKPPVSGRATALDQRTSDFINLFFGFKLPETPRTQKGKVPLAIIGEEVSRATLPGRVGAPTRPRAPFGEPFEGRKIQEVNPVRAELERELGAKMPSLIEAIQKLNLENIKDIELTPEQPQFRGNTLALTAGFQAAKKVPIEIEGPDGKKYKATFDGYWDLTSLNRGHVPAITALEDTGVVGFGKGGSGLATGLESAGYKLPELPSPEAPGIERPITALERDYEFERNYAEKVILGSAKLEDFPYYADYESTIKQEAPLLQGSKNVLFIGGGPMPLSSILLSRELGVPVRALDISKEAVRLGNQIAKVSGESVILSLGDASKFPNYKDYDAVVLALEAGTTKEQKAKILDNIASQVEPGTKILARGSVEEGEFPTLPETKFIQVDRVPTFGGLSESILFEPKPVKAQSAPPPPTWEEVLKKVPGGSHGYVREAYKEAVDWLNENPDYSRENLKALSYSLQKNIGNLERAAKEVQPKRKQDLRDVITGVADPEVKAQFAPKQEAVEDAVREMKEDFDAFSWQPENEFGELIKPSFKDYETAKSWASHGLPTEDLISPVLEIVDEIYSRTGGQFAARKKLPNAADEDFQVVHYSSVPGLNKVDPSHFGKGKATPVDLRGGPKSYFFVKGSEFGQDAVIFKDAGLNAYEATVPGAKLYDLRQGKSDPLEWRKTVNREEADDIVQGAGYDGLVLDTADGRQVVAMFKSLKVTTEEKPIGQFAPKKEIERALKSAAVKDPDTGEIYTGPLHPVIISNLARQGISPEKLSNFIDGFVTNEGKFLDREQAFSRALNIKQVEPKKLRADVKEFGMLETTAFQKARKFQAKEKFSSDVFDEELRKIKAGESGGQTFTAEGNVWIPDKKKPSDIVTLASVNLPAGKIDREAVIKALGPYEELLDEPGVVAGVFSFSKEGKPTVSIDVNTLVPQKYRDNSVEFAANNDQVSIWDPVKMEEVKTGGKGNTRLRSTEEILDAYDQLSKGKPVDVDSIIEQNREFEAQPEQAEMFGGKEIVSSAKLAGMTKAEIAQKFPEAIIPRRRNEIISSDITESPLYKQAGSEDAAVSAFSRRLVEFAKEYEGNPAFEIGKEWYEKFTPLLKKEFGKDAQVMAELLAATSPQTTVEINFSYANDALEGFRSGRFKKQISKFNEGLDKINDGSWLGWYNRQLKAGKIPNPPKNPTPEAFLGNWIETYDLKPKQSNGKLYGQHSSPVLQVFARKWLELNKGPKVSNFVKNLLGTGEEAIIDLWADRTMRRVGYAGSKEKWRILPKNQGGVGNKDFFFAQKAFRMAAEELGIKPSALQGALWFAEKQLWANEGWGRLDLGDFRNEMKKLPMLRAGIKQRLKKSAAESKLKPEKTMELGLVEPRTKSKFSPTKSIFGESTTDEAAALNVAAKLLQFLDRSAEAGTLTDDRKKNEN